MAPIAKEERDEPPVPFACAAVLALISAPVRAHDYWIERSGDSYTLYQGHVYSSHKGEERVPYDPAS